MTTETPWWGVVSSAAAPVLLIGGWTVAAARQDTGFDSVTQTISALAALDASDRWVMTAALTGLGLAHMTTALALRSAATGAGDPGHRRTCHALCRRLSAAHRFR